MSRAQPATCIAAFHLSGQPTIAQARLFAFGSLLLLHSHYLIVAGRPEHLMLKSAQQLARRFRLSRIANFQHCDVGALMSQNRPRDLALPFCTCSSLATRLTALKDVRSRWWKSSKGSTRSGVRSRINCARQPCSVGATSLRFLSAQNALQW